MMDASVIRTVGGSVNVEGFGGVGIKRAIRDPGIVSTSRQDIMK
jgi:hypothetical protein